MENQLPTCPNLVPDDSHDEEQVSEPLANEDEQPAPTFEEIYSGKKVTAEEADTLLQSKPFVVILGGMVESGKTTLLARIFEMFQAGPVAGHRFMTSKTPIDFEKLSWHATMECGASHPSTEHTYRSENNLFLHMRVRHSKASAAPLDLLLGDIPGEIFPEAVAEEKACLELHALCRANHLVLFLDSGVLCNASKRHDHCGKIVSFVNRALQTGQVGQHTVVHVVISKCDLLPQEPTDDNQVFVTQFEQTFRAKFVPRVGGLHFWRLAARPVPPFQPTISQIQEIFRVWITRNTPHGETFKVPPIRSKFSRDFCRFGL